MLPQLYKTNRLGSPFLDPSKRRATVPGFSARSPNPPGSGTYSFKRFSPRTGAYSQLLLRVANHVFVMELGRIFNR